MRLARDRLIFLCLAALDDVVQRCATAPVAPTPQFRAVLATLYALGDRPERAAFDAVWRSSQLAPSHTLTEHQANHRRMTDLARLWPQICHQVGVEPSTELTLALAAMRRPREDANARAARILREIEHERRVLDRHRRQKQQCTIPG